MEWMTLFVDDPHSFKSLYSETESSCDCSIQCIDGLVPCHKEVLCYWSSYLKDVFKTRNRIYANTTTHFMSIILPLLYLGKVEIFDMNNVEYLSDIIDEFIENNQLAITINLATDFWGY
jgi:protein involved in sex pheromone biosynthesis